jgi:hypothetical protein
MAHDVKTEWFKILYRQNDSTCSDRMIRHVQTEWHNKIRHSDSTSRDRMIQDVQQDCFTFSCMKVLNMFP